MEGNYTDLKGQAFSFTACRLINRHRELQLQGRGRGKKRQIIQGPCFLEGIGFLCFSRFKEADGLLCLTAKSSVDLGEEVLENSTFSLILC